MKKIFIILLLVLFSKVISAQGMFTETGKFSVDAGMAYLHIDTESGLAYNLSASIVGTIDIGADYFLAFQSDNYKRTEGGAIYCDMYMYKGSYSGAVFNLAYSSYNYTGSFIVGFTGYARAENAIGNSVNLFPYLSIGSVSFTRLAFGIGFAIEKEVDESFSMVIIPQASSDGWVGQYGIALELILK